MLNSLLCVPPKRENEPKGIKGRSGLVFTLLSWNHPADIFVDGNIEKIALARGMLSRELRVHFNESRLPHESSRPLKLSKLFRT